MNFAVRNQLASERHAMVLLFIFDTHEDRPPNSLSKARSGATISVLTTAWRECLAPPDAPTSGFFMRLICLVEQRQEVRERQQLATQDDRQFERTSPAHHCEWPSYVGFAAYG
nr:hypothetical protein [Pseudomonas sp. PDM32]